jgi:glycosyltransferase involved in cell wall biosynthesis
MVDYYPRFSGVSDAGLRAGNGIERAALDRAGAAIYASEWAAESAMRVYGADPARVHVLPFGANLTSAPDRCEIASLIGRRSRRECRLLFVGVDWHRKGGDLALGVAARLVEMGIPSRLTVVGCGADDVPKSRLVDYLGFIDKSSPAGEARLAGLLAESHFLCLPSRAECFGIVFCEASAFGLPSIAVRTGGVASAVRHATNGYLYDEVSFIESAAASIADCMADYDDVYTPLALSSYEEYRSRLNWTTSTTTLIGHVARLVAHDANAE